MRELAQGSFQPPGYVQANASMAIRSASSMTGTPIHAHPKATATPIQGRRAHAAAAPSHKAPHHPAVVVIASINKRGASHQGHRSCP